MQKRRIVVGISGASGFQYGAAALRILRGAQGVESHLIVSKGAELTRALETSYGKDEIYGLADVVYAVGNLGAPVSSGSFPADGMIIAPCSMRTLGAIAHGLADNLITRAADVSLKERRRLVLMVRETPLNLAHLDNMRRVTEMGGIVFPPVPALYHRPQTADEIVAHSTARALSLLGIPLPENLQWRGGAAE
ncbi:Phenolic acid decarboxylase subunit B [Kingella potus]|uniref:Flavin prenyltransferase UbiX n=1 Tax=Kingella potus TaxID=265175 RepID=A0A377R1W4_9NEIS|nr:UbiX family flavin prenyltransferase [Kingella potus]UOP00731.1 UbiX family flavin prenyltransferase [Kingella potus]STR02870.1 Phenolic acid decarboxylase subunit B [Kingella potus]